MADTFVKAKYCNFEHQISCVVGKSRPSKADEFRSQRHFKPEKKY